LAALLGNAYDNPEGEAADDASFEPTIPIRPKLEPDRSTFQPDGAGLPSYTNAGVEESAPVDGNTDAEADEQIPRISGMIRIPIADIEENPFQPRREFSEVEIASLAESLKDHDLLQPVLVRKMHGRYQLISGERRLRAATRASWTSIPARITDADDRLVAELAIVENLQRKDLNAVEKALAFKRYLDEHGCPQEELANRLKIDRSTIANLMRLLELPHIVLDSLRKGTITAGHARAMLPLGEEHSQIALAKRVEGEGLSVREVERLVEEQIHAEDAPTGAKVSKKRRNKDAQVASLEQEFRRALGTKVDIKQSSKGKGTLTIHFLGHEEFERLRTLLNDTTGRPRHVA